MSAVCSRCGDCCDPVVLLSPADEMVTAYIATQGRAPARNLADGPFVLTHWTRLADRPQGGGEWACSAFNAETRECEAHEDRPLVCSGYPWYNREPDHRKALPLRCSYRADLGET